MPRPPWRPDYGEAAAAAPARPAGRAGRMDGYSVAPAKRSCELYAVGGGVADSPPASPASKRHGSGVHRRKLPVSSSIATCPQKDFPSWPLPPLRYRHPPVTRRTGRHPIACPCDKGCRVSEERQRLEREKPENEPVGAAIAKGRGARPGTARQAGEQTQLSLARGAELFLVYPGGDARDPMIASAHRASGSSDCSTSSHEE